MKGNMNRRCFLVIAITGIVLGVPLLAGGIFAASYHTGFVNPSLFMTPVEVYPYAAYSCSLMGGGAVSIFVGIAFVLLLLKEETNVKHRNSSSRVLEAILLCVVQGEVCSKATCVRAIKTNHESSNQTWRPSRSRQGSLTL